MSLSGQHKDAAKVQAWLDDCKQSFTYEVIRHTTVIHGGGVVDPRFLGYLPSDVDQYFEVLRGETELLATLDLIASIEAAIKVDYTNRVERRIKDNSSLGGAFKALHKRKKERVSLEDHILHAWKTCDPNTKSKIDDFEHVLDYRHWLAHGRYWVYKSKIPKNGGAPPTFIEAKNVADKLLSVLKSSVFGFYPQKL